MFSNESSFPQHIFINSVLSYLDLYALVGFSRSSRKCQNLVHREMPKAHWREINLSGNRIITDDQLCALLRNVNAKENTHVLSLVGCLNVEGPGLEPLRGSKVLRNIDLRVRGSLPLKGELGKLHGPSGLKEDRVADVLFSMLPSQSEWEKGIRSKAGRPLALRRVVIRPPNPPRGIAFPVRTPVLRRFFRYHGFLLGRESYSPRADPSESNPPDSCPLCFIKIGKYKKSVFCSACNKRYCRACAMPPKCSDCPKVRCQWCSNVVECAGCNKRSCASHGYECCGMCDNVFCQDCHDELEFCVVCNEHYCTEECHRRAH